MQTVVQSQARGKGRRIGGIRRSLHPGVIYLIHMVFGTEQPVGQLPVVRQQQQALRILVKPSHRRKATAAAGLRHQIHHRGLAFVLGGCQHSRRFVQQQIQIPLAAHRHAVHGDGCCFRGNLHIRRGCRHAVHQHAALPHQFLYFPTGGDPSVGNDLIQTLHSGLLHDNGHSIA